MAGGQVTSVRWHDFRFKGRATGQHLQLYFCHCAIMFQEGGNIAIVKEKEFTPRSKMKLCGEVLV